MPAPMTPLPGSRMEREPLITFARLLHFNEQDLDIVPPFTPDEQALALAVARALNFAWTLHEELPERAGWDSLAAGAWNCGIRKVREKRAGRVRE